MKRTKTKNALVASMLAMLLCIAMLVGSTFAWFTDTASTGVNKIQTGKLDIGFQYWDGTKYVDVTENTVLFNNDVRWEPGHVEVAYLKISNDGNLALKYALSANITQEYSKSIAVGTHPQWGYTIWGPIKQSDYIKFAVIPMADENDRFGGRQQAIDAANTNPDRVTALNGVSVVDNLGVGEAQYVAVMAFMPETVGNEINLSGWQPIQFGIAVHATQNTVESDSFGSDYDASTSANVVASVGEWDVLCKNSNVSSAMITEDMAFTNPMAIPSRDFDLYIEDGNKISINKDRSTAIKVTGVGNEVTITGGTVESSGDSTYAVWVDQNGGTTTIKDGHFISNNGACIFVSGGTVVIEGGLFECKQQLMDSDGTYKYFVLNLYNSTSMPRNIVITGGTFVNYNPEDGDNVDGVGFVADDYKVVAETQANGDIWYTVVAK